MRSPFLPPAFFPKLFFIVALGAANEAIAQAPSVDHGKALFQQNCAVCHATGEAAATGAVAGQGPLLAGVMGRQAATVRGFGFTKALEASRITWTADTLDKFLAAPATLVPGTNMVIVLPNPADRADVIAYLATLKPVATPAGPAVPAVHDRTAGDWQNDAPGAHHRIDLKALPAPYATKSAGNNPRTAERPADAKLSVPAGFQVKLFASGLSGPRLMRTAPNGDIFISETRQGRLRIIRATDGAEAPTVNQIFVDKLRGPFGLAFYPLTGEPQWLYVANLNSVVRFPYHNGDLTAGGPPETIVAKLSDTTGGHSTRDIAFSLDGQRMFISVGSGSNVAETMGRKTPDEVREWESTHLRGSTYGNEENRADVLVADPAGKGLKVFAAGIRNAVGLAVQPGVGELWCSVNERDGLGDDLVPDYISRVKEGGYYGWPWYYMGNHEDPRHAGARPDLAGVAIAPDVPVQAHSASLQLTFYPATVSGPSAFPADYRGDIFAALHGSWNRTGRTGSKVIRVHLQHGQPTGEYEDFLTGFVIDDGHLWGRPVGVTTMHDGSLLVTDDANGTLWRVSYMGK